jgi:hypothetical protein
MEDWDYEVIIMDLNRYLWADISTTLEDWEKPQAIQSAFFNWSGTKDLHPMEVKNAFDSMQQETITYLADFFPDQMQIILQIQDPKEVGYHEGLFTWLLFSFRNEKAMEEVQTIYDEKGVIEAIKVFSDMNHRLAKQTKRQYDELAERHIQNYKVFGDGAATRTREFPPKWATQDEEISCNLFTMNMFEILKYMRNQYELYEDSVKLSVEFNVSKVSGRTQVLLMPLDYETLSDKTYLKVKTLRIYIREMIRKGIIRKVGRRGHNGPDLISIGYWIGPGPVPSRLRGARAVLWLKQSNVYMEILRRFDPYWWRKDHVEPSF